MDLPDETVLLFAVSIGINVEKEKELLRIARKALTNLPPEWELGIGEDEYSGYPFFHNIETDESIWTHPEEDLVRQALDDKRKRLQDKKKSTSGKQSNNTLLSEKSSSRDESSLPPSASSSVKTIKQNFRPKVIEENLAIQEIAEFEEERIEGPYSRQTNQLKASKLSTDERQKSVENKKTSSSSSSSWEQAGQSSSSMTSSQGHKGADHQQQHEEIVNPARSAFRPKIPIIKEEEEVEEEAVNEFDLFRGGGGQKKTSSVQSKAAILSSPAIPTLSASRTRDYNKRDDNTIANTLTDMKPLGHDRQLGMDSKQNAAATSSEVRGGGGYPPQIPLNSGSNGSSLAYELDSLRMKLLNTEKELLDERSLRRRAEEERTSAAAAFEQKLRNVNDESGDRGRESLRKVRAEVEEDMKERLRSSDRRHNEELEALKESFAKEKKKSEELREEVESYRKKLLSNRETLRTDINEELERMKVKAAEAEEAVLQRDQELRQVREQYVATASKLAVALQVSSVASAEMEALRVTSASASAEAHTCHAALVQATQRLQTLEGEIVGIKAENYLVRQENESLAAELRKVKLSASCSGDRAQVVESEVKRTNNKLQSEVSRLSSRVAELEAIQTVQRAQLDSAEEHELQQVREVQRHLDRAEYEIQRLKGRLLELDSRREADSNKLLRQEGAIAELTNALAMKEKLLKEESLVSASLRASQSDAVQKHEESLRALQKELKAGKNKVEELQRSFKTQLQQVQDENAESIPKLVSTIHSSLQDEFEEKLGYSLRKLQIEYEEKGEGLRRQLLELETTHAEQEAKRRISLADERAELESLRTQIKENKAQAVPVNNVAASSLSSSIIMGATSSVEHQAAQALEAQVMEVLQMQLKAMRGQLLALPSPSSYQLPSSDTTSRDLPRFSVPEQSSYVSTPSYFQAASTPAAEKSRRVDAEMDAIFESPPNTVVREPVVSAADKSSLLSSTQPSYSIHDISLSNHRSFDLRSSMSVRERLEPDSAINSSRRELKVKFCDELFGVTDFSAISDGGYHENYWKYKYSSS